MAVKKKFGAFSGVFTPSILTILGVIMYMRLGWVVGQAGIITAIGIIMLAHIISITTGPSIPSIATDKRSRPVAFTIYCREALDCPWGDRSGSQCL